MSGEKPENERRNPEDASVSAPVVANSDDQTNYASEGSKPPGPFRRWLGKFNEPLTVVTVLLFGATVGLVWETRDLVLDAKHNAERQLRAYVGPSEAIISGLKSERPKVWIKLKNFGLTPATGVKATTLHNLPISESVERPHNFGILDPNNIGLMLIELAEFSPQLRNELAARTKTFKIETTVKYQDAFGHLYERKFAFYMLGGAARTGAAVDDVPLFIVPDSSSERTVSDRDH